MLRIRNENGEAALQITGGREKKDGTGKKTGNGGVEGGERRRDNTGMKRSLDG